ncbi:MAG: L-lactate permease [Actinobacteria bacterium]|nr:MAG: L-lactate permease [Actinomycetota bacterium]
MQGAPPVTLVNWLLAFLPLAVLIVLLLVFKWTAAQAGSAGFFVALAVARLVFQSGLETVSIATAKGIWDGIFILYVVWPALLLYQVNERAGAFDVFRETVEGFTKSRLILVLAFGWVFASFLQSVAGFGTPIAIVAPLLVEIGVAPIPAVVIPLIGQAWANMFGTLGVPWLALLKVVSLQDPSQAAFVGAALLWLPNAFAGVVIAWIYGRTRGLVRALPVIATISLIQGGGQLLLSQVDPVISNFVPNTVALFLVLGLVLLPAYREEDAFKSEILTGGESQLPPRLRGRLGFGASILPYLVLVGVSLLALLVPAASDLLGRLTVGFPFPESRTGLGVVVEAAPDYGAFAPFQHPGTFLLVATAFAYVLFRKRGLFEPGAERQVLRATTKNALPASVAILAFLTLSKLMDHSGMISLLANGLAAVSPAPVYAFLSNLIGALGGFMTSSTTASNILLGPLQAGTARALALSTSVVMGAQSAGAAIADAISPANIVLGTGTAGVPGREGEVLKYTLVWVLVTAALIGAGTLMFL